MAKADDTEGMMVVEDGDVTYLLPLLMWPAQPHHWNYDSPRWRSGKQEQSIPTPEELAEQERHDQLSFRYAWEEVEKSKSCADTSNLSPERLLAIEQELREFDCPACSKKGSELRFQYCQNDVPPSAMCDRSGYVLVRDECQRVAAHYLIAMS